GAMTAPADAARQERTKNLMDPIIRDSRFPVEAPSPRASAFRPFANRRPSSFAPSILTCLSQALAPKLTRRVTGELEMGRHRGARLVIAVRLGSRLLRGRPIFLTGDAHGRLLR